MPGNDRNATKLQHVEFRWSVNSYETKEQQDVHNWCKSYFSHFIYQLENPRTDDKDNFHYQGYGTLLTRARASHIKKTAISLNGRFKGIRIEPTSTEGRLVVKSYCMKMDSRVAGPWSDRKIYEGKDLPSQLYPWQEEIKDRCLAQPDDRTVNYVIDPIGKQGKSKFVKYMCYHHKAVLSTWGKTGDIINLVSKASNREIFLFDLSRTKPKDWARDDIAAAMEQIKNGHIVNWKFETGALMFDPPHVWCFSNQPPNLSSMSNDRWQLWEIDGLRELKRVDSRRLKELNRRLHRERSSSPHREPESPLRSRRRSSTDSTILIE